MKKITILFSIVVVVVIVVGIMVFLRDGEFGEQRTLESQATSSGSVGVTNSVSSKEVSSKGRALSVSPSAKISSKDRKVLDAFAPIEVSGNVLSDVREASARGVLGAALTPAEAKWMDAQGMPGQSMKNIDRYRGLSLAKLKALAEQGSVPAAVVGARKVQEGIFKSEDTRHLFEALSSDNGGSQEQHLNAYVDSSEMQQQREFLWQAVVHGSSYAARTMAGTYADPLRGRCLRMNMCTAWALIAWRMGDWKVVPPAPSASDGRLSSLYSALEVANRVWAELNRARAEQGLLPLGIDLRPAYGKWREMQQHPGDSVRVYPR